MQRIANVSLTIIALTCPSFPVGGSPTLSYRAKQIENVVYTRNNSLDIVFYLSLYFGAEDKLAVVRSPRMMMCTSTRMMTRGPEELTAAVF